MKPLKLAHPSLTRKALLRKAETIQNSHRWLAVAFDWLENDGRESPVRRESTSDRGLGSQSQQQGDRQRHETIDLIEEAIRKASKALAA